MTAREWVNARLPGIDWRFCRNREFSSYGEDFVECAVMSGYGAKMTCHYPELVFTRGEFYNESNGQIPANAEQLPGIFPKVQQPASASKAANRR